LKTSLAVLGLAVMIAIAIGVVLVGSAIADAIVGL
jgi:hypothetical protein